MSMLGNWQTINTCVLTSSWHIRTEAQFAGTCIGVFLIVFLIETVRRWSREFDRWILERAMVERRETRRRTQHLKAEMASRLAESAPSQDRSTLSQKMDQLDSIFFGISPSKSGCRQAALDSMRFRPKMWQQLLRSLLYGVQFTGAYLVMLIAMTFNGYIIIAIVLGGIFGHFFSTWDTLGSTHLVDVDPLGAGYAPDAGTIADPSAVTVSPCCQPDANKDSASVSSGSDDGDHLKRRVVTLPDHGYGSGACCV
ncbi:Ctr copper transporter [Pseudozyma hubeiensis SY62]|uniref:Copper transport protein n=1 Tax=Pseudozyma hubeiensis (strain SY62) TaxID=1305764 RepID=R9PIG7_PSEHS|nr:Ctr copper transporter [Pseudozyma hubeiensis SY62]GAC97870.1 Ctr copper transporter [Pseudozyma hubeiensis SY62]